MIYHNWIYYNLESILCPVKDSNHPPPDKTNITIYFLQSSPLSTELSELLRRNLQIGQRSVQNNLESILCPVKKNSNHPPPDTNHKNHDFPI